MAHQGQELISWSIYQFLCFLQHPGYSLRLVHLDLHRLYGSRYQLWFLSNSCPTSAVPLSEDFSHVFCRKAKQVLHQVIAFLRSIACHHTRYRCGPFSHSDQLHQDRCTSHMVYHLLVLLAEISSESATIHQASFCPPGMIEGPSGHLFHHQKPCTDKIVAEFCQFFDQTDGIFVVSSSIKISPLSRWGKKGLDRLHVPGPTWTMSMTTAGFCWVYRSFDM